MFDDEERNAKLSLCQTEILAKLKEVELKLLDKSSDE